MKIATGNNTRTTTWGYPDYQSQDQDYPRIPKEQDPDNQNNQDEIMKQLQKTLHDIHNTIGGVTRTIRMKIKVKEQKVKRLIGGMWMTPTLWTTNNKYNKRWSTLYDLIKD